MRIVPAGVKAIGAVSALAFVAASTHAADIPAPIRKAPAVVAAPAANWTGFHIDVGIGYGTWAAETFTSDPAPPLNALPLVQRHGGRGWLGRVGGGFDYQFHQRIVAGLFADFDWSAIEGTISDPRVSLSAEIKQTRSWAVGARAGWLINPALLSYFTAGFSQARFSSGTMQAFSTSVFQGYSTPAFTADGWFLGGGAEIALGGGWYARTEYRYAYYGDEVLQNTSATPPAPFFGTIQNIHFKPTVQTATTQLVYRYNPGIAAPPFPPASAMTRPAWSGAYVNAGFGYGMWAADETTTLVSGSVNPAVVVPQRLGGKGWLGRAGIGYDHRFTDRIVAGLFGDVDVSSLKGSIQDAAAGLEGKTKQAWAWAAGTRAGWLATPDTLAYLNAGYAQAHFSGAIMSSMLTAVPFFGLQTPAFTTDGWFFGGGVEAALGSGWFWRNEYRRASYGNRTVSNTSSDPAALVRNNINFEPTVQTVTSQLIYKFN